MITDGKKWHYLTVKSLSALLKGISSNGKGEFYCLNCFCHIVFTVKKLKKHERVCNDHDYCYVERQQNIKIQLWRKVIKSSSYYLCWLRVFAWNKTFMSK